MIPVDIQIGYTVSLSKLVNYLGQLRFYSYADLVLLFIATGAPIGRTIGASMLWFGFLVHLEWRHRDRGRALWPWYVWFLLWIGGTVLLPDLWTLLFIFLSAIYALKKRVPEIAWISFAYNGALKAVLFVGLGLHWWVVLAIGAIMALRNLAGDIRDAGKDRSEGVKTLPVVLGLRVNVPYIYPIALIATSFIWTLAGGLPLWMLVVALVIQTCTYKLTPR